MKRKVIKWTVVILLPIILLVSAILYRQYRLPVSVYKEATFCSLEGDCLTLVFDVKWSRFLTRPSVLWGEILWDGEMYHGIQGQSSAGFIEGIKEKLRNEHVHSSFMRAGERMYGEYDRLRVIEIVSADFNLGIIAMLAPQPGTNQMVRYYYPAATAEEAYTVMRRLDYGSFSAWIETVVRNTKVNRSRNVMYCK